MSHGGDGLSGRQGEEDTLARPTATSPEEARQPQQMTTAHPMSYKSGCPELDDRVLGSRLNGGLSGGVVGMSADGDIGISVSLQVAVQHLRRDATATARLVTTLPVAHVVRLLKGVLKGVLAVPLDTAMHPSSASKASIVGRVLISRVYGPEDLLAVLDELEAGVPFQRLWSAGIRRPGGEDQPAGAGGAGGAQAADPPASPTSPAILILTEMDHHFKWMRLQGHDGRIHEVYGQLMRRLRVLTAVVRPDPGTATAVGSRPLIFVLNGTMTRRPQAGAGPSANVPAGKGGFAEGDFDDSRTAVPLPTNGEDANFRLALTALQQGRHVGQPGAFRLCCEELARAQCIEPLYRGLINYFCSLHICFTRLPPDLVDAWGGREGSSSSSRSDSSLWVATVESDETEISKRMTNRVGVVHCTQGFVQDASSS